MQALQMGVGVKDFLLLLLISVIAPVACTTNAFRDSAKELKTALIKVESIKGQSSEIRSGAKNDIAVFEISLSSKVRLIEKMKTLWPRIAAEFRDYIQANPGSVWRDDAGFCIVLEYLSISQPGTQYSTMAIREIRGFLKECPTVSLEGWTKHTFKDIPSFEAIIDVDLLPLDDPLREVPESERIRGVLSRAIVFEFLKQGDVPAAQAELNELLAQGTGQAVTFGLRDAIETYQTNQQLLEREGLGKR